MNRTKSNLPGRFDPFSDRMARDIRNSLSEAFVAALAQKKRSVYQKTAGTWLNKNLSQTYVHYIRDRLRRYGRVFEQIETLAQQNIKPPRLENPAISAG